MLLTRTLIVVFVALCGAVFSDLLPHQTHDQTNNRTDPYKAPSLHPFNYTDAEMSTQTFRNLVLGSDFKELRVPQTNLENVKSRDKRSAFNLFRMVGCATDYSRLRLMHYGNHCGWGGSGIPIDGIDRCCQRHDYCYGWVMDYYDKWSWSIYFRSYKWYCNGGDPYCSYYQDNWKKEACSCDLHFIKCLQRVQYGYNY